MKPVYRGIVVTVLHCLIALSVFGKYSVDRERLPRVWAKAAPFDPVLPLRGRYLTMRLEVATRADFPRNYGTGHLAIHGGQLFLDPGGDQIRIMRVAGRPWTLIEPVAFFLPEHADDPSRRRTGQELWVEVSVPPKGPPRPIRLEVR